MTPLLWGEQRVESDGRTGRVSGSIKGAGGVAVVVSMQVEAGGRGQGAGATLLKLCWHHVSSAWLWDSETVVDFDRTHQPYAHVRGPCSPALGHM